MTYLDHGDVQLFHGDAATQLRQLPDGAAQTIVTSPPFWGLRDYGSDAQIGREADPDDWAARLVRVMREARRVLRDDGALWLEVGDSRQPAPGLKPKDLVGAPWLLAFALRDDGWYLRADVIWHRENPMPESVVDRPTTAHSYVFLLSKRPDYYYDGDAIRELLQPGSVARYGRNSRYDDPDTAAGVPYRASRARGTMRRTVKPTDTKGGAQATPEGISWPMYVGANRRSVWTIPTESTPFAHFAVMPSRLAARCIAATSRPGDVVLDPFAGTGTTAFVARRMGRRSIGVELQTAYLEIAAERLAQQSLFSLGGTDAG